MKLKKKYTGTSIYYFDQMSKKRFHLIKVFVDSYLEKSIGLHDMFGKFNSFINMVNDNNDNYFVPETKFNSLSNLLETAGVTDLEHVEIFLEIYHSNLNNGGTARERALLIHQLWRDKALELRDLDV